MVISTPGYCHGCHEFVEERNCEGLCTNCSFGDLLLYDIPGPRLPQEPLDEPKDEDDEDKS